MSIKEYKDYLDTEVYRGLYPSDIPVYKKIIIRFSTRHFNPSRRVVYLLRKMQYFKGKGILGFWCSSFLERKIQREFGCYISSTAVIGKGFHLPHPVGVIIGAHVVIEDNVSVYQDVTIGGARIGDSKNANHPHIRSGVIIFSGAKVLGAIMLASNTIVAANAVLLTDTDENGVYGGIPARRIK